VIAVRHLEPDDAPACDAIIAGLPDWFGNEQGVRDCAQAVRTQDGLVALDDDGVVAFLTWSRDRDVAEITWMATRADGRRSGAGRRLIEVLVGRLVAEDVRELHVKTLSEREPYPPYEETRAFYRAMGFTPVAELDIWGPENPAVLLVREL
jgi:N-acetylglutamate synthase-like GNAT family acetyltransferase